jgi:riboflavin synthase
VFSGIVTELGEVLAPVTPLGGRLRIAAPGLPADLQAGESVAVNGICLTVIERQGSEFSVDVMPETARRTTIAELRPGDAVNLEPALVFGKRVGGHLLSGHVDAVTEVLAVRPDQDARRVVMALPAQLARYVVEKGCIAVDGISLTVVDASPERFSVSLIPHTLSATSAGRWRPGSRVNLEADLIAKYVQGGVSSAAPLAGEEARR